MSVDEGWNWRQYHHDDPGLYLFAIIVCTLADGGGGWRMPLGDDGQPCPWPLDPVQLYGAPLGQYHCPSCGSMVLAGVAHINWDFDAL